ncbi:GntR family transcriptional regulator [Algibacter lectus]|uniref:Regulatory GntR family protein n=1 Tax=Algibacter lectus TaxID=221126 RepID=A0A4R8MEX3_9FLAO|nr:GntR family transcriptional regulator [Algibacter lectus]MWW23759.1 GntR family transcriptional regulator [Algibacter lectus]TDY63558.1 regulatory GntR family protein [Algibacter lectus]
MDKPFEIKINEDSRVPKYKQIVDSIVNDISRGKLLVGEKIPSINELSESCYLSRDTVEKAYRQLKEQKAIVSVKGKGFYTAKTDLISKVNVFFMINKLSNYKMMIYNSFVKSLGSDALVTLSVYHCEESIFIKTLEKNLGAFDYYVIMPHFKSQDSKHISTTTPVKLAIDKVPKDKLVILDNSKIDIAGNFAAVYQDFKEDIYEALQEGLERLKNYDKLVLIYPDKLVYPYPKRIVHGFQKFCAEFNFEFEVLDQIYDHMDLDSKDAFIIIEENDLVNLVRQVRKKNLVLGTDIGIISYNDTPLKDLLGINVVSTDFQAMGDQAAYLVLNNKKNQVKNVFNYIERNSI